MAAKKNLSGMEPVRIYPDARHRLKWYRLPEEEVPKPYTHYWAVYDERKRHVADLFRGKYTVFAVIFGVASLRGPNIEDLCYHIVGLVLGPQH